MGLFHLLGWVIYGLIVAAVARWLSGDDKIKGFLMNMAVSIGGSFFGGFIHYCIFGTGSPIAPSGWIFGILGATILCWVHKKYFK